MTKDAMPVALMYDGLYPVMPGRVRAHPLAFTFRAFQPYEWPVFAVVLAMLGV